MPAHAPERLQAKCVSERLQKMSIDPSTSTYRSCHDALPSYLSEGGDRMLVEVLREVSESTLSFHPVGAALIWTPSCY